MKTDETLLSILSLCKSIDQKSAVIYSNLSKRTENESLCKLWEKMSEEEKTHVEYWQFLNTFAQNGTLPQIFDDPFAAVSELKEMVPDVDLYLEKSKDHIDDSEAFYIACGLELFMLHRSFTQLFYYAKSISQQNQPIEEYEDHLSEFLDSLKRYTISPELKLLGNAIKQLWKDNRDLVTKTNEDFLTSIFNRKGFFQTIIPLAYMANRENNNIAIAMIDADDFKAVNDTHGHQKGDEVLKFIAETIKSNCRRSDIVGRYGGEEFILFLSDIDPLHLFDVAEKIRASIESENRMGFPVTVSIGIAQEKISGDVRAELDKLIKEADGWLYKAKHAGKNQTMGKKK